MDLKKLLYNLSSGFTILPVYLAVNIVNVCNRKCNFCPYHSKYLKKTVHNTWFRKQPEYINYVKFANFIKKLGSFREMIKSIAITGKGEPLKHPDILNFCQLLNFHKLPFSITTNGDYVTDKILYNLLSFKYLTGIRVSLYDTESIETWIERREKYNKISLFNQTGIEVDGIQTGYTVQNEGTEDFCTMPKDFNKIEYCKAPFSFLTINTDGSVVPCYSYHEIGNINDSFLKLWNGKKIRKYRKDAMKMQCTMSDCKNCGINIK